jgi:hypothetical protein
LVNSTLRQLFSVFLFLASQTWATGDFISATASIDAVYNALYPASGAIFSATTGISGQVASIDLFDTGGSDNFGSNAVIVVNGLQNILFSFDGSTTFQADANDRTTPDNWTVSAANAAPEPSTLGLIGLPWSRCDEASAESRVTYSSRTQQLLLCMPRNCRNSFHLRIGKSLLS